jgi:hypothetical protein
MAKQTFTTGQVLTAAQMTSLQQTAMGGGSTTAKTASYVLVAADAGTVVQMNSASATTITVNTSLFAAGDTVQIQNLGAGVCTVTAGTATVSTSATLALKQYDAGSLYFNSTSAAIFFAVDAADGMANVLTTTGDIIYSSSGTTAARLGIGTTGQVLNVASGIPAWATPATSGFVGARVYKSIAQAFTTATFTEVSWDLENFDTSGFHDNATNNNRFTIPSGKAGYYRVEYQLQPYNTGDNYWKMMKNGSVVESGDYAQVTGTTGQVLFLYIANLAVADYVSFQYAQYSGSNKNVQATGGSYAQITYLGA